MSFFIVTVLPVICIYVLGISSLPLPSTFYLTLIGTCSDRGIPTSAVQQRKPTTIEPFSASTTRGHCQIYQLPYSRLQCHQQSFFPSTIRLWNELPAEAVSASTVDAFKTSLPIALHQMYIDVFNCTYSSFGF